MTYDVFVSYSSEDKVIADSIVAAMEHNHIRCWYAPRDIKPSEDWGKAIASAIEQCRVFLVIFSKNANRSQRVLDEVNLAISQQAIILPFRIENLEPKGAMKLHLSSRHWLDAYEPSWETHIKKLIKDVSANLETAIDEQDIVVPEGFEKKANQQKKLARIAAGIAVGTILVAAGWFGWTSLNKQGSEIPALTETETSLDPGWEEEFSEPILMAINNQAPAFQDNFSQKDPDWRNYSDDRFCDLNKSEMNITNGSMQCSISPGCPFFVFTHPDIEKQDSDYVLQMDVTFPEHIPDLALEFSASIMDRLLVDFILSDESWAITIPISDIDEAMQGIDAGPIRSNASKPVTLTIMKKDTIFLFYRDSVLLTSYGIQPEEADGHRIQFSIANWSESLIEAQMIKLDNLKVWSLKTIDY